MLKKALITTAITALSGAATVAFAARTDVSPAKEPHFVTIGEVVVPVIDGNRVSGRLVFDVVVDAPDANAAARLALAAPRLRSTSIATGIEFSRLYVSGLTPVNAELLSQTMSAAVRRQHQWHRFEVVI